MEQTCAVILAAGDGKRMKSAHSKVLCQVLFKPMISWVLDSCRQAGISDLCVVVSDHGQEVEQLLPAGCATAVQRERKGTGHAMLMAADFLRQHRDGHVIMLYGDAPFVDAQTIQGALAQHLEQGNALTVVAAQVEDPTGYGRIVRDGAGALAAIVEHRDADEAVRAIREINSGVMWFRCDFLLEALEKLTPNNAQGEYYITDTVAIALAMGRRAGAYLAKSADVVLGANDRQGLAKLNRIARQRQLERLWAGGVNIPIEDGILIAPDVQVGEDTTILPGTILGEGAVIGKGCVIGPNSQISHSVIGDEVTVQASVLENCQVGDKTRLGPFMHVRPGSIIGRDVKIGNFVEIKNSVIGDRTSVAHLTYLGDSDLGTGVNVGCGVVTANYDGANKFRTTIGDGAFIGCNTNLVAPVSVGEGAITAAGTTVTQDVPADALAMGRARQINKENWAREKGKYHKR